MELNGFEFKGNVRALEYYEKKNKKTLQDLANVSVGDMVELFLACHWSATEGKPKKECKEMLLDLSLQQLMEGLRELEMFPSVDK